MLGRSKGKPRNNPSSPGAEAVRHPVLTPRNVKIPGAILGMSPIGEEKRLEDQEEGAEKTRIQEKLVEVNRQPVKDAFAIFRGEIEDPNTERHRQPGETAVILRVARPTDVIDGLVSLIYKEVGADESAKKQAGGRIVPIPIDVAAALRLSETAVTAGVDYTEMQGRGDTPAWLMQIGFNLETPVPDSSPAVTTYILLIATEQDPSQLTRA